MDRAREPEDTAAGATSARLVFPSPPKPPANGGNRPLWFVAAVAVLCLLFPWVGSAAAEQSAPLQLAVVTSGNDQLDERLLNLLRKNIDFPVVAQVVLTPPPSADLVLALGPNALRASLSLNPRPPILALFIASGAFRELVGTKPQDQNQVGARPDLIEESLSAVYVDPPLHRQALLGRLLVPSAQRVALLDSPDDPVVSATEIERITALALTPAVFAVDDSSDLVPALNRALDYGDFLLGTPSQHLYNRNTIKHLLLTAYRRNHFLIGPSKAFVRAGALASTYTTPEQFGRQAARLISEFRASGRLPQPQYAREFEIDLNTQVARSLNLVLPETDQLKEQMMQLQPLIGEESREISP